MRKYIAEFVGTLVLTLVACGVAAITGGELVDSFGQLVDSWWIVGGQLVDKGRMGGAQLVLWKILGLGKPSRTIYHYTHTIATIHKLSQNYTQTIPELYTNYPRTIHKLSQNYTQTIATIRNSLQGPQNKVLYFSCRVICKTRSRIYIRAFT